ncbi:MAG: hypothetical protein GF334_06195 [Candidatus Altiarchaeales archaeon]|nr:hypothetical protein [Candidatus Altiarchaeales archaeon]
MAANIEEFVGLQKRREELHTKKIRLEEQYKSKKKALTDLVEEIKSQGYDPSKLKDTISQKEKELTDSIEKFKAAVEKASSQLAEIEV